MTSFSVSRPSWGCQMRVADTTYTVSDFGV